MKALIEFNLPEDYYEYQQANKANEMQEFIDELRDMIRTKLKYEELTKEETQWWERMEDWYYDNVPELPE